MSTDNRVRSPRNLDKKWIVVLLLIIFLIIGFALYNQKPKVTKTDTSNAPDTSRAEQSSSTTDFEKELGRKKAEEERLRRLQEQNKPRETVIESSPEVVPENETPRQKYERLERQLQNVEIPKVVEEKPDPIQEAINAQYIAELTRAMNSIKSPINYAPYTSNEAVPTSDLKAQQRRSASTINQPTQPRSSTVLEQPNRDELKASLGDLEQQKQSISEQIKAVESGDFSAFGQKSQPPLFQGSMGSSNGTMMPSPPEGMQTLSPATVISATLESNINSDTPGQFIARLDFDVWDIQKKYKLLNRGDRVLGQAMSISTPNPAINSMMGMVVKSIVRNDGLIVDLTDYQMLDEAGNAGVAGDTNYHILPQLLATVAYATTVGGAGYLLEDLVVNSINKKDPNTLSDDLTCTTETTTTTQPVERTDPETGEIYYENQDVVTTNERCGYKSSSGVIISVGDIPSAVGESDRVVSGVEEIFVSEFSEFISPLFKRYIGLTPTIKINSGAKLKIIITEPIYITPIGTRYDEYVR